MTKEIPSDAEYSEEVGNITFYYKCDENDNVYVWQQHRWVRVLHMIRLDLESDLNVSIIGDDSSFDKVLLFITCLAFVGIYWYALN